MRFLLQLVSALLPTALVAASATLEVPAQYPTIQAAIIAAQPGDTLLVSPGHYWETITFLGKDIEIKSRYGARVTTIHAQGAGSVVRFLGNESSAARLTGFTLRGGIAASGGGIFGSTSSATIRNCVIRDNHVTRTGGGVHFSGGAPKLINCVLVANGSAGPGGGLRLDAAVGAATVAHCTVFANQCGSLELGAGVSVASSEVVIANCIIRGNAEAGGSPAPLHALGGTDVRYSNFENAAAFAGEGLIDAPPRFVDTSLADFHLRPDSPCIDAGENVGFGALRDFDGNPRAAQAAPDMGADEFYSHYYVSGNIFPGATVTFNVAGQTPGALITIWLERWVDDENWDVLPPSPPGMVLAQRRLIFILDQPVPADGVFQAPYLIPYKYPVPSTVFLRASADDQMLNTDPIFVGW